MKKRLFALLLAAAMLLLAFSGCGNSSASSVAEEATTSSAAQEAASEETSPEPAAAPETAPAAEAGESAVEEASAAEADEAGFVPAEPLSYPIADGTVTFTILHSEPQLGPMSGQMEMDDYGDFETIAQANEVIGVTPQWQSLSQMNGDTQFNLIMASGDYPDVIAAVDKYYVGGFPKAYEDEVIINLDDYLEEYMPEYWNLVHEDEALLRAVTDDNGSFLSWYSVYDKSIINEGYFIRKDWCDLVGMDVPTSIDEANEFAYAIKDRLGLESVFLMGDGLDTFSTGYGIASTVSSGSGFAYHREGDTLVADVRSDRLRSFVTQLHQWYEDGIVSRNFTELDTSNMTGTSEAELAANRTAIVTTMVNSMDNLKNDDPDFELAACVVTADGGNIHTGVGEREFDSTSISTQCDEDLIPYIMGWMNYWYTEEGAMAMCYGIEGVDYDYNADGSIYYTENITANEYGWPGMLFSRARCFSGASFGLMYQDRTTPFYTEAQTEALNVWTSRTDDEEAIPDHLSLTTEESEVVALYATDLATYVSEEIPKFVTGDIDLSTWDDFVANCEGMHVQELIDAYQAAYDRYTAA